MGATINHCESKQRLVKYVLKNKCTTTAHELQTGEKNSNEKERKERFSRIIGPIVFDTNNFNNGSDCLTHYYSNIKL